MYIKQHKASRETQAARKTWSLTRSPVLQKGPPTMTPPRPAVRQTSCGTPATPSSARIDQDLVAGLAAVSDCHPTRNLRGVPTGVSHIRRRSSRRSRGESEVGGFTLSFRAGVQVLAHGEIRLLCSGGTSTLWLRSRPMYKNAVYVLCGLIGAKRVIKEGASRDDDLPLTPAPRRSLLACACQPGPSKRRVA